MKLAGFVSGVSAAQDWLQGQAAAVLGGMGFARQVLTGRVPGESVRILPAPGFGPRRANPSVHCVGLGIPAGSSTAPEAAWALVEWLALGEPARERFAGGQGLPASRTALPERLAAPNKASMQFPWQQQLSELVLSEAGQTQAVCIQTSPFLDSDFLSKSWSLQEERYLTGQLGLDEMLAAVEADTRLATLSKANAFS